jgi:hypothetical protein
MTIITRLANVAAAVSFIAVLAGAAPARAEDHRLDAAWKAALDDHEDVVTEQQHAVTNAIAYHAAAAKLCDGIDLDTDTVGEAVNGIAGASDAALTDDQRLQRLADFLVTLGTAKGIFLAEGALQQEQFCEEAMAAKADPENQHFWT